MKLYCSYMVLKSSTNCNNIDKWRVILMHRKSCLLIVVFHLQWILRARIFLFLFLVTRKQFLNIVSFIYISSLILTYCKSLNDFTKDKLKLILFTAVSHRRNAPHTNKISGENEMNKHDSYFLIVLESS